MSDPVENNLPRRRLGSLNRVLLRVAVQEDVQFRHFGNPTAIDFAVKLDGELHSHSLPLPAGVIRERRCHDHALRRLGPDTYLLTYTLRQIERITRRATIWQTTPEGWRILYHQGTMVSAEEDDTFPRSWLEFPPWLQKKQGKDC